MQGLPQPASKSASPKLSTRITDRNQNDSDSLPIRSLIGTKPPRFKQIESPLGPPPRVGVACLLGGAVSEEVERRISDILVDVGAKVNVQIEKRAQQDKDWLKVCLYIRCIVCMCVCACDAVCCTRVCTRVFYVCGFMCALCVCART